MKHRIVVAEVYVGTSASPLPYWLQLGAAICDWSRPSRRTPRPGRCCPARPFRPGRRYCRRLPRQSQSTTAGMIAAGPPAQRGAALYGCPSCSRSVLSHPESRSDRTAHRSTRRPGTGTRPDRPARHCPGSSLESEKGKYA